MQILAAVLLWSASSCTAQTSTEDYDKRLEKAVGFYAEKKFSEASALLECLTRSAPERKEAFLWLGNARSQMQNWIAAEEAYKSYIVMAPGDVEGFRGLARAFEMQEKYDLAKLYYKKALDLEPGNEETRLALKRVDGGKSQFAPETPPAKPEPKAAGFWQIGLAGVCKARTVWWGRLIAILLFGIMQINGALANAKTTLERFPNIPRPFYFFNLIFGASFSYILFWGIPNDWGWALLAGCVLATALGGTKALTERSAF